MTVSGGWCEEMEREEIDGLLVMQLQEVLALDTPPALDARLSEDLRADSLDLVEVIEGGERALAVRDVTVRLDDDALRAITTVGDAADALRRAVRDAPKGGVRR